MVLYKNAHAREVYFLFTHGAICLALKHSLRPGVTVSIYRPLCAVGICSVPQYTLTGAHLEVTIPMEISVTNCRMLSSPCVNRLECIASALVRLRRVTLLTFRGPLVANAPYKAIVLVIRKPSRIESPPRPPAPLFRIFRIFSLSGAGGFTYLKYYLFTL